MIKDTRGIFLSVSSEFLSENLVSAGTLNGIPSYYSYPSKSIKKTYSLKYFLLEAEIQSIIDNISNYGYNKGKILDLDSDGNITNLNINDAVYINGQEYFSTNITATQFPEYKSPEFDEEIIYENQTKIVGFYLDGTAYIDDVGNAGKLTKTKKTVLVSDLNDINKYEVTPKSKFGDTSLTKYTLSITSNNFRYIIDNNNKADLYVDIEIIEIE